MSINKKYSKRHEKTNIKIAKDLELGTITEIESQNLLLSLFSVSVTNLDILEASVDESVDLLRKEGFIQGAKWFRKKFLSC